MESPPRLDEVQTILEEARGPYEQGLTDLRATFDRLWDRPPLSDEDDGAFIEEARRLRRDIRAQETFLEQYPPSVLRTLVVSETETGEERAIAVVPPGYGDVEPLTVRGWTVRLRRCTGRLMRCRPGDVIGRELIVWADGGDVLSDEARQEALQAHRERTATAKERRLLDRERRESMRERFRLERLNREQENSERLERLKAEETRERLEKRRQLLQERAEEQARRKEVAAQVVRDRREREEAAARQRAEQAALPPEPGLVATLAAAADRQASWVTRIVAAGVGGLWIGALVALLVAPRLALAGGAAGGLIGCALASLRRTRAAA